MEGVASYRTYWGIWGVLLVLTLLMISMEALEFSRRATLIFLPTAMLLKATLIAGWFMHLRYERMALVLSVVVGTLATAGFLFFLLVPDGLAALELAPR